VYRISRDVSALFIL